MFTKTLSCSGSGEPVESLLFHLFQPALEDQIPHVTTGVSALISTHPRDSVNATLASTGQRVSCAGQGDSGLTVSVCGTHSPELLPVVRLYAPCPDAHHPPELEASFFLSFPATHLPSACPHMLFSSLDIFPFPSTERASPLEVKLTSPAATRASCGRPALIQSFNYHIYAESLLMLTANVCGVPTMCQAGMLYHLILTTSL